MSIDIPTPQDTRLGGFGHSADEDAQTAGRDAVRGALDGRTPAAGDLIIIFPSAAYDLEALHAAALAEAGPAALVGATTVGAFTDDAQLPFGCVAAFIAARDGLSFGVSHVERDDADISGCTRRAAETARDRAGEELEHSVLMLLCDGLTPDQRAMARGAYEVTSAVVPLVGGAAGDDLHWQATYTFGEGRVLSNGLVAVWINSPTAMAVSVDHGWRPFGKPMLVTRAEGAVIHELDGLPALDAYVSERGAALKQDARSFGEKCMRAPDRPPQRARRLRPAPGPRDRAGRRDRLLHQRPRADGHPGDGQRRGVAARGRAPRGPAAAEQLEQPARLALVFSCCTRAPLLGARLSEEVELIAETLGGVPAGGFYTCGEFARVTGSTGIHNSSVALLVL